MLSILLYGRNDAHGYNLHKRAALSLNAIAAALTDPADEILFVDYNTPDELPTFPEAIADTLTDACKARMRVIRVRPRFHRQFAGKTRLAALESQSRNIAVRRANPANKWILSTNTDMIFCPKDEAASLTSVIAGLEEGFYHLPRFEVPEGFWERLDRTDPQAAMAAMRRDGKRFHLNEIVWGIDDNLFEAPGDFQLFTRDDLFAIEGFDERMVVGWHVDSNIARRMRLLRGEVKCVFPDLAGYHCGHTRQATSLHGGNRTQNDFEFFVTSITNPVADFQAGTWGSPDEVFEEVRLDRPDLYLPAMAAAVPTEGPDVSEVTYNDSSFGRIDVDTDHALPHLCDLLFNFPPGQTYFFFGADIRLLDGLRDFLETAGRAPTFLLTDQAASPDLKALDPARWEGAVRPLEECLDAADVIVLQNPSASMQPDAARLEAEWWAQRVFALLADQERARPAAARRRVIVVNAIHTGITNMVESTLAPTVTPFSSRLRQGFVVDDTPAALSASLDAPIYERLRRAQPFTPQDRTLIDKLVASLQDGLPIRGWERMAPEIAAICTSPAPIPAAFRFSPQEADAWAAAADVAMRANAARAVEEPVVVGPRVDVGNRLLSGADWDDPTWARMAVAYFGPNVLSFRERKRWVWERASLARALQTYLPVRPSERAPKLLLLANGPEYLAAMLTHMGYEIEYAAMADFVAGRVTGEWESALDLSSMLLPRPLRPYQPGSHAEGGYDALVVTLPSLFEAPHDDVEAVLHAAAPLMAPGAHFFASATVQMNEVAYEGAIGYAEWKVLYDPEGPLGLRGFQPVGGFDARVPLDTAVRFAPNDDSGDSIPGLSYGFLRGFNTSALLSARWPDALRPGPVGRIEYGRPERPDPSRIFIPYSGAAFEMSRTAAIPAAEAAAFVATCSLADTAREALNNSVPLDPARAGGSALPYARSLGGGTRSPVAVELEAPGGAGLVLPIAGGPHTRLRVELTVPAGVVPGETVAVNRWGGALDCAWEGQVLTIRRDEAIGDVCVAVRFSAPRVSLTALRVLAD